MADHGEYNMRTPVVERSERQQRLLTNYFVRNFGPDFNKQKETAQKLLKMGADKILEDVYKEEVAVPNQP